MDVTPGSRLGPYEIVSRIGAGGMGEVFRAKDTRLDRSVAIKVLPEEFARNSQLKVRFEREAKAISQLNHPNICTLYDVGDGYLVMELMEGETLADRLNKGPLPLPDVLKYGAQIADALDRAHRAGIVHRDLKPANVMITKAGAKLLDFGLAKTATAQVSPDGETQRHDKTLTQEGTILGTFQYMAPEQLEAEEADARTDIFALGAVLYEMATGKRAFDGKTRTSLIAAIVAAQPKPISQLIPLTPAALDHVIQKCLEKDRDDRWQSAHDVAEELKWIATTPPDQKVATGRAAKFATAAAIILALALAGVTAMLWRARNAPRPRVAFSLVPPKGFSFNGGVLSPDGSKIAFLANNSKDEGGIWIRPTDAFEARRLTTSREDYLVAWSPDSKWIAYTSRSQAGRQLNKIAVDGGPPEVIQRNFRVVHGAWSPNGTLVYSRNIGDGLHALPIAGGDTTVVTTIDQKKRESFHAMPRFLSDGKRFLYVIHTIASQKNEIWAGSIDGKLKKMVMRADSLVGLAQGHVYFVRDGAMYAQELDEDDLRLLGQPRRVVERVYFYEPEANSDASVAATGAVLYRPVSDRTVEWGWYDRNARRLEKILEDADSFMRVLSADETRVAAEKFDPVKGANDIYVVDLARGIRTRVTSGLSNNVDPVWSPTGDRIYFVSDRDGPYDIFAQAEDGATPAVPIWKSTRDKALYDISPAGDTLLAGEFTDENQGDIMLVPVDAPDKRRPLVATEAMETGADFSPDGRWIVYMSDRSGRDELYMRRVDGGRTTQITTEGLVGFVWGLDGSELLVRTLQNDRASIPLNYDGDRVVPGKPISLFTPPSRNYGIAAVTKKGLLMNTVPDPSDYISLFQYDSAPLQ